jgi:AraC family transcriptional regulator
MTGRTKNLFGNILKSCSFNDLTLTETQYAPFSRLPEHSHSFAYFCFVLQGAYTENDGRKDRLCTPSTLIFHSPHEAHSNSFHKSGGRCFNIQIQSPLLSRVKDYSLKLNDSMSFNEFSISALGTKLYREFCAMDEVSPLAIEGLILEIMAETARNSVKKSGNLKPRWVELAKEILHSRFSENLTINEIAELVGRHPVHLAREFRKHFHSTIGEYIRQLRVDFAFKKLSASNLSLTEIALDAGFSHQSHFSKTFKLVTGKTPSEYREFSRRR